MCRAAVSEHGIKLDDTSRLAKPIVAVCLLDGLNSAMGVHRTRSWQPFELEDLSMECIEVSRRLVAASNLYPSSDTHGSLNDDNLGSCPSA